MLSLSMKNTETEMELNSTNQMDESLSSIEDTVWIKLCMAFTLAD